MAKEFDFKDIDVSAKPQNTQIFSGSATERQEYFQVRPILSSSEDTKLVFGTSDQFRTSSINFGKTPNYYQQYQVVQGTGRSNNNKDFVERGGVYTLQSQSVGGSTLFYDTNELDRKVQKTFFVNKFSSPGGPETNADLFLDVFGGEYSVYNELNNRNLLVRSKLNEWLSECYDITSSIPSFHKFNRNRKYYIDSKYIFQGASSADDTFIDLAECDNAHIQHQIPRSDKNYWWIRTALQKEFIYEPQYRNEFENQTNLGVGILYAMGYVDSENIVVLYFKDGYTRLALYRVVVQDRLKTLQFITEDKVKRSDFFAPNIIILNRYDDVSTYIISGIVNNPSDSTKQKIVFYQAKIELSLDEVEIIEDSEFLSGGPFDTGLTLDISNGNAFNYTTARNDYRYDIRTLSSETFCIATVDPSGDKGRFIIAEYGSFGSWHISSVKDLNSTNFPSTSGIYYRTIKILFFNIEKFVIIISDNQNTTTAGTEYIYPVTYTYGNFSSIVVGSRASLPRYYNNLEYRYLTASTSEVYYAFIGDTYPQATISPSSSIYVGLMKVSSSLDTSRIFSSSVATGSYFSPYKLDRFTAFSNALISSTYPQTEFDILFFANVSQSYGSSATLYKAKISTNTSDVVVENSYDLYLNKIDYTRMALMPTTSSNKFDVFLGYQPPDSDNIVLEHCYISNNKLFRYFVDEELFNNSLETIWTRQLYKNYSAYFDMHPQFLPYYYFSFKEVLNEPTIEFCGTNISTIKEFNEETNTVSLNNNLNYENLLEYLANLNGFYGFSSWKQIRNQDNYYALKLKRKNKYFIDEKSYLEPVVTYHYPLEITSKADFFKRKITIKNKEDYITRHTFIVNDELAEIIKNVKYGFQTIDRSSGYEKLKKQYSNIFVFDNVKYSEQVFPKKKYTSNTRIREYFNQDDKDKNILETDTFWFNDPIARQKTFNFSENNLGYRQKNITIDTENNDIRSIFGKNTINYEDNTNELLPGLCLNVNNSIWSLDNNFIYKDKSYNVHEFSSLFKFRPQFQYTSSSFDDVTNKWPQYETSITSSYASGGFTINELLTTRSIGDLAYAGFFEEKKFFYTNKIHYLGIKQTPRTQYIFNILYPYKYEPYGLLYDTLEKSGKKPGYDNYYEYAGNMRLIGKNYSIIPEYNISDNLQIYLSNGNDFLNKSFLRTRYVQESSSADYKNIEYYNFLSEANSNYEYNQIFYKRDNATNYFIPIESTTEENAITTPLLFYTASIGYIIYV